MSQKKILIIDYDAESLKSLSDFAREEGCEVVTASDGITGLEKFKADRPDLVIMEAMLPKLHGFELCKKIAYDSARKVPVIIVTGIYRESVYKSEAVRFYGASAFFEKPWKKEDLQPVVRSLLKEDKPPAAAAAPAEAPPPARRAAERKPEISDDWGLLIPSEAARAKAEPPEGAADVEAEIDTILQSALADLGLKGSHEEKPEPPREREKAKPVREAPVFTPPPVEEKPAAAHREAEEKPAVPKPGSVPFGGFIEEPEKKKSKAGIFVGLGIVVVAAAAVYFFVLKPKPPVAEPTETAQQTESTPIDTQTSAEPSSGAEGLVAANQQPATSEPAPSTSEPQQQPQAKAPESKPAAKPQASPAANRNQAVGSRASDPLAPIVPSQTPSLQLEERPRQQESAPAQAPANEAPVVRRAQEGDLIPLEQVDVQPVTVKSVPPAYPEMARRFGVEGTVSVNALISETGDVIQTQILRGIKGTYGFDRAAETSMRQWKFRPAMKDGARVKVWKPFNVVFRK